jgi:hypothetical protein
MPLSVMMVLAQHKAGRAVIHLLIRFGLLLLLVLVELFRRHSKIWFGLSGMVVEGKQGVEDKAGRLYT